jgi:putative hydrolase of the HAD superfamily
LIKAVVFDFGGVIADEGFKEDLRAIAAKNGLDPDLFFARARELIYETGYVTGRAAGQTYWDALRRATGIHGTDSELREEIITRFRIRHDMLEEVDRLQALGFTVAILSDQTDWLDEIDRETGFSRHFDHVLNSFHLKKSKREDALFREAADRLGRKPKEILFVDDGFANVNRAMSQGWQAIHFHDIQGFTRELAGLLPGPVEGRDRNGQVPNAP